MDAHGYRSFFLALFLVIPFRTAWALRTTAIPNIGYFKEPLGSVSVLDHYHNFLFFVDLQPLKDGLNALTTRAKLTTPSSLSDSDLSYRALQNLNSITLEINRVFDKIGNTGKEKRSFWHKLRDLLGSVAESLSGTLDQEDLGHIIDNITKLSATQNSTIRRVNNLVSLADHISARLANVTKTFNRNYEAMYKDMNSIDAFDDIMFLIQNEQFQAQKLLDFLLTLLRTISFAFNEVPSLEILSFEELLELHSHLKTIYSPDQLILVDSTHPFEVLEFTKLSVTMVQKTIIFLLRIPICKPNIFQYSKVYSVPTRDNILIIPPKRYTISNNVTESWTDEDCKSAFTTTLCVEESSQEECQLGQPNTCQTAKATNDFHIVYTLQNRQLLTVFRNTTNAIEDCRPRPTIIALQGAQLVSSPCPLVIGASTYDSSTPKFEIAVPNVTAIDLTANREVKLRLQHFVELNVLQRDIKNSDLPLLQTLAFLHYVVTGILTLCLLVGIILAIVFRQRLSELLCKSRPVIHVAPSN